MLGKRVLDILGSLLLLILFFPLFCFITVFILIESSGPVFFRQVRVGRFGTEFEIYKFRSMIENAENVGGYQTRKGDLRITKSGSFLRKTSLDELPQLLNVLKGDMSLVGPRPDVPGQRKGYTQIEWRLRHSLRPGMTGLAQAVARSRISAKNRKKLDLIYIDRVTLGLDLKILVLTLRQVMKVDGI